jgi:hypothetical protein
MCIYESYDWDGDGDMITDLPDPFENDLSQHLQGDAYHFGDEIFFYEYFQTSSPLILEEYQDIAIPRKSKVHSTKKKFCHIGDSH